MYRITLKGNTRYAEFSLDASGRNLKRELLDVSDPSDKNDCLSVVISDDQNGSNLEENWMLLHGKPWQIALTMDTVYQVAKLETNRIFDYLDTVGKDTAVTIAYPMEEPSLIIGKSRIHRTMRANAKEMIEKMFEIKSLYILPEHNHRR